MSVAPARRAMWPISAYAGYSGAFFPGRSRKISFMLTMPKPVKLGELAAMLDKC